MSKSSKIDPTKDPQFQNVVQHFLTTKPTPHKPKKKKKTNGPATSRSP